MNTYYDEAGKVLGHAHSTMPCSSATNKTYEHPPHDWTGEYAIYGPYMCGGYPKVDLYDAKPRKPVN